MTGMKLRPSMRKHMAMPTFAMRKPAIDGPMMRAQLKAELLSEMAFIRSSRLVISMTNDCRAGMSNAMVIPPRTASTMMCHGCTTCVQTSAAMVSDRIIEQIWVHDDDGTFRVTIGHPAAPGREEKHRRGSGRGDEPEQAFEPVS